MQVTLSTPVNIVAEQPEDEILAYVMASTATMVAMLGRPGHDLATVLEFLTRDSVMEQARDAYRTGLASGVPATEMIYRVGDTVLDSYAIVHGLA